ncbi:MAG: hypothetical protein JWR37_6111 [Mycobacterium sp.]|jgi:hypothetical protein|nr:hypothetical protein [Mycobacterium sp.]
MRTALTLAAVAVAGCGVIAAPAGIASADESAQATISRLQSEGYQVNIDRVGSGALSDCVVTGVRNPQTVTQLLPLNGPGNRDRTILVPVVISQSISVSLDCSR